MREPGGVMRRERISAVRTYSGIDNAQPWCRPLKIDKGC